MLTVYCDESYTTTTYAVGGFVGSTLDWLRFEPAWLSVLQRPEFGLDHFHMNELRAKRGAYAKFQDRDLERALLERLMAVIRAHPREAVGANIDVAAYDAVDSVYQLTETFGGKFALAGCVAIDRASRWRDANHPAWPLEAIFDGDNVDWERLRAHAKARLNSNPGEASDEDVRPLQAADFAAWEFRRAYDAVVRQQAAIRAGQRIKFRGSFDQFMADYRSYWAVLDYDELVRLCEFTEVPKRS